MTNLGDRIRECRMLRDMTQDDLAKALGESSGRIIHTWEKGTSKPDAYKLVKLAEVLKISVDELLGCKIAVHRPSEAEWASIMKYRTLDQHGKDMVDYVLSSEYERVVAPRRQKAKPHLIKLDWYRVPVSAGTGTFLDSDDVDEILVPECQEAEEADFVLTVHGDSMEPTFHDDDKIFVCKQDAVDVGDIGIFVINGEAFVKELGNKQLISHNEAYKPIPLKDHDSIYCCGRVLGVVGD